MRNSHEYSTAKQMHVCGCVNSACQTLIKYHLQSLIRVHDDRDEDAEYDVDEEADEEVEVDATVPPHHTVHVTHCRKRREDVIAVDETEETFRRC